MNTWLNRGASGGLAGAPKTLEKSVESKST